MKLERKVVLITGGGSGIGRALAAALAERGNRVIVCGRDGARLGETAAMSPNIMAAPADVTLAADRKRLLGAVRSVHHRLDILVNNAGVQYATDFLADAVDDLIDQEIAINLTAPIRLIEAFLPLLRDGNESAIVNVTSALAVVPKRSAPVYCATKAGLHAFSTALRYQLAAAGIRVFDVMPPLVDTAMTAGRGGAKIAPAALAEAVLAGLAADRPEIRVGKAQLLLTLHRLWPSLARQLVRNQ